MSLNDRRSRYQAIEDHRNRPLIVYATSTRQNVRAQMAGDAVREFIDQIDAVGSGEQVVDVLIHSTGGDALVAWKLMSLLRERFANIAVLVPSMAFSAATIFALGADEIIMHPHASLGPIDPQITVRLPDGSARRFAYEDVGAFLRFLVEEAKIKEETHVSAVINKLFDAVDPVTIGAARRASDLSTDVGERMLLTHMRGTEKESKVRKIASDLNKGFFAHGDAVSRTRALDLRMKIADRDETLERLMWSAYLAIEEYLEIRRPFNPLQIYLSDSDAAAALQPPPNVNIPPNAPPQVIQVIYQQLVQQQIASAGTIPEVEFSIISAVIESTRVASEFRSKGTVLAWRGLGGKIEVTVTDIDAKWDKISA